MTTKVWKTKEFPVAEKPKEPSHFGFSEVALKKAMEELDALKAGPPKTMFVNESFYKQLMRAAKKHAAKKKGAVVHLKEATHVEPCKWADDLVWADECDLDLTKK